MYGDRYSYELRGQRYYIYDGDKKIADVSAYGSEALEIAKNITYSLNMRDRWLVKKNRKF